MIKKTLIYMLIFIVGAIAGFALKALIYPKHDIVQSSFDHTYEAVRLHSDEGKYITWGIKETDVTANTWTYITPEWFSKFFGVEFFWCNHNQDYIIYDGDTGMHLYIFDSITQTWSGAYYLKEYTIDGITELYYWSGNRPIGPYIRSNIPEKVLELVNGL